MSPKPYEPSAVALEGDSACRLLGAELLIGMGERGALVWQIDHKKKEWMPGTQGTERQN